MEDFLLRTKSTLVSGSQHSRVHGVLGGVEADITCVASTLGYAYFLSQRELGDCVCVPVLYQRRSDARVPEETRSFLQGLGVPESALLWRDDIELHRLHTAGKLSLTLLHTDLLNVEDGALASCVVRVINCSKRQGAGEGASSTVMVAREILQKAPERLTAPLAGLLRGALLLESVKAPYQDGHSSPDHEELLRALEHCCHSHDDVIQSSPAPEVGLQGASLDQMLLKELKELSDGDIKVSVSMVSLDLEAYSTCPTLIGDLKLFCDRHGYEGLVILSSSLHEPYHQCQQVAVFSGNKDILNQICCELEEGRSWSLGLEPLSCTLEAVQLYHQRGASVYTEQIITLLQEFLDRRQRLFLPNSRTSSTEGVAGSAPLSQGSSGITDMYSSDAEPANTAESVPEPGGAPRALGEPGTELASPDSGLVTVRSSRSSKESSVFLSDDSPVAETTGFLHNPALSFPSLCAAATAAAGRPAPRDRGPSARNKSDNLDLFGFDPLRSGCTSPAAGGGDEHTRSSGEHASSSLSEFGELSLVDFYSESSGRQSVSESSFLMEGGFPSPLLDPLLCDSTDDRLPATPVNSLVEGNGVGGGGLPKFFPDVAEKINQMGNKESVSSSEPWDDFTSDTKGSTSDDANTWSLMDVAYVGEESPDVYLDEQANDVRQARGEGSRGDDDSFLLVSMDSGAMPSSARDTLLWASSVPNGALDISDPAATHLGRVRHGMLPSAGESQEGAGVHLNNSVLDRSEPSSNYPISWGHFDERKDHDGTEMSDVMRPFNVCETQEQPEDREDVDELPSSPNQEHHPATPRDAEKWGSQEEGNGFLLAKDRVFSHHNTDYQTSSGVERFAVGGSTFQTQQVELGGVNAQPLEDEEGSLWRLDEHQLPDKQESLGKEWQPAECAPAPTAASDRRDKQAITLLDADSEQEVHNFSDVGMILSDVPETHVPTFPEHSISAAEDPLADKGKAHRTKEPSLSPDSAHVWNPFVQMTQQAETYDNWNPNLPVSDVWNPGMLGDLQLTPPEEDTPLHASGVGEHLPLKALASLSQKTPLTPETSKEGSSHSQDGSPESDFWSYSAQRGFLEAAGPYPESLGLWNTTIQDDSQSTLSTPDFSERSDSYQGRPQLGASLESPLEGTRESMGMWNTTITDTSPEGMARPSSDTPGQTQEERGSEVGLTEPGEPGDAGEPGDVQVAWQLDKLLPLINDYGHAREDDITTQIQCLPGHLLLEPSTWNAMPTCGSMVKSVSEYDNVDPKTLWYQTSPELEVCQEMAIFAGTQGVAPLTEECYPLAVHKNKDANALPECPDSADDFSCHSPFVLLGITPPPGGALFPLNQREDTSPSGQELTCTLGKRLSSAPSRVDRPYDWDDLVKLGNMKLPTKQAECEGPSLQQRADTSRPIGFSSDVELPCVVGPMPDIATLSMASASPGSRETDSLDGSKASPDPLQRGSREDVRSNSDGDSSGLEMEYIMVSGRGTVREAGEFSPLYEPVHSPHTCLTGSYQSNTDAISPDQSNTDAIRPDLSNSDAISTCQTDMNEHIPYQAGTEVSSLYQSNLDLNSPDQMTIELNSALHQDPGVISPHHSNGYLNNPYETDLHMWRPNTVSKTDSSSPQQLNTDSHSPCPIGSDTASLHQSSTDASSATVRESSGHFRSKEEIYVRSQISLEDSEEEEGGTPGGPQSWVPLAGDDPGNTPSLGDSSGMTNTPESDSGRSVREVGSPFACDLTGDVNGFFWHQATPPAGHSLMMPVHAEPKRGSNEPMGGQLLKRQSECKGVQPIGDQFPEDQREHLSEQQVGDQPWPGLTVHPAEQTIGDQLWSGLMEHSVAQPMGDQQLPGLIEAPGDQPMKDQRWQGLMVLSSKQPIGGTAERVSEEPKAAEDSGLRGLGGEECRTNIVVTVTEPDDTQGMSLRSPLDDVGMDVPYEEDTMSPDGSENRPAPPSSLDLHMEQPQRKKLSAPEINLSLDQSEGSILSDDALDTPDDLDIDVDELDTPDEADSLEYTGHNNELELEWEESQPANQEVPREAREAIPEYTAEEERQDARLWRTVIIGEQEHRIDMKSIEPYQKVISHGGYYGDLNAIIVFAACFLPDSNRDDYHYVMENLFLYVISTLELMVAEDYMIIYLNGATPRRRMPGLGWLKKCYYMIDRRLRKNLKSFVIVHPSWFIRTILAVTRPFISSKFSSKIKYVSSLAELRQLIPMEYVHIPESVVKLDEELKEATEAAKYTSLLNGGEAPQIDKTVNASGS